jgi:diacylglycerol diphosphate phosphatase / phosphatidate phosphatase
MIMHNHNDNNDNMHDHDETQPTESRTRFQAYICSYDCLEFIACFAFACTMLIPAAMDLHPRQRPIPAIQLETDNNNNSNLYVRNQMFNEPYKNETVPDMLLFVLAFWLPLLSQIILSLCKGRRGDIHATLCTYLVALSIVAVVTEFMKLYVGYLRPIFFSVCQPTETYSACTSDHVNDVRKSFLSGHASLAFGGLMLLSLYIHTRLGVPSVLGPLYDNNNHHHPATTTATTTDIEGEWTTEPKTYPHVSHVRRARIWSMFSLLPFGLACFIAASRVVDNKHHPADVVGGAVLGASVAHFVHGLWFY